MTKTDTDLKRFGELCLSFPETTEVDSWGHPNYRAGKRTFASFEWVNGRSSMAFRLGAADVDFLLRQHEGSFITPYGKGHWISLWADSRIDWPLVEELAERSYRLVALKRMIAALDGT